MIPHIIITVVDPGFPRRGGAHQLTIWPIFPEKCMKMEVLVGGRASLRPDPLQSRNPPMLFFPDTKCDLFFTSTRVRNIQLLRALKLLLQ